MLWGVRKTVVDKPLLSGYQNAFSLIGFDKTQYELLSNGHGEKNIFKFCQYTFALS